MSDHDLPISGLHNVRELIVITTWYLWWERRRLVHEENIIIVGIYVKMTNYVMAHYPKATTKKQGWTQPPMRFVQLNVDASFDHDLLRDLAGVVLRDASGKFIVGVTGKLIGVVTP